MEYKNRSEVEEKYKWDVDLLVDDFSKYESKIYELLKKVVDYKGKILKSADTLLNFYKDLENLNRASEYLYMYAHLLFDSDTTNPNYQSLKMKTEKIMENVSNETSFIEPEILESDFNLILDYIKENKELEYYKFDLEKMFRYKKYTLSKKEEEIITKALNTFGACSEAYNNIENTDIDLGFIIVSGEKIKLTNSNYSIYMNSKDRNVRIQAFNQMYNYYKKLINTISSCLKGNIKENFFLSKVRGFKSPLSLSLYADNIDVDVYKNLIEVTHKNLDKLHNYMKVRKKFLNLDEMHMYDIYVNLKENESKKIPFSEAKEIVLESLKPLGDNYVNDLKKAFSSKWIDIYPNKGKKSGAYSWGCFDTKPYTLLNYNDSMDSVSTLAHELGHSMHSYYSKERGYLYHSYPIFLAEIASTVNEVLLNEYQYKNADKDKKIVYLTEMLDKIRTTIYRQVQFAEFEMIMHDKEEMGIPLTAKEFSDTYYELNKKYYGDNIISDDLIRYEWARIPHFYTSFYVYKYATGLISALAISSDILKGNEEARDKYLEFLHAGSSDYPLNILKNTNVDITSSEVLQKAFDFFDEKVKELEKLI